MSMEKRILIAFTLSFLVFAVYLRLFGPRPVPGPEAVPPGAPEAGPVEAAGDGDVARAAPAADVPPPPAEPEEPAPPTEAARAAEAEREIVVETSLYRAVLTNRGGRFRSFVLKEHADSHGRPYEMVPQEGSARLDRYPLDVELGDAATDTALRKALFVPSTTRIDLRDGEEEQLVLEWADGRGLVVRKRIRFLGGTYRMAVVVGARRGGTELGKRVLYGPGVGDETRQGTYVAAEKGVLRAGGELRLVDADDIDEGENTAVAVQAVGVAAHYFTALMLPEPGGTYGARLATDTIELEGGVRRTFITAALEAPTDAAAFTLFVGPKDHELLAALAPGMEYVIEYGAWMRYLALPLRAALLWIHGFVGNYGWSIVLLTVLINVALVPLKHHSYVSMRKMQKLAPQIKRIQERYKKLKPTDPRRQEMNKEIYALYREHNVSPLSGCLPMLLMIPFFFAFYQLLRVMIELRHAPFVLWIDDLSSYDPYFVLPILMGVSQLAMQQMTPQTSADPAQARLMKLMPIVFTFILAWAPSGLVLYWFVNNLVSMGQQWLTNKLLADEIGEGHAKAKGKPKGKGKKKAAR